MIVKGTSKAALFEMAQEGVLFKQRYEWLIENIASLVFNSSRRIGDDGHVHATFSDVAVAKCPGCGKKITCNHEALGAMLDRARKVDDDTEANIYKPRRDAAADDDNPFT